MIEDLRDHPRGLAVQADFCLIGAGAAGITIARELAGTGLRVCLVEGGGLQYEFAESQSLYAGTSVGLPVPLQAGRLRFFGGTTNHWQGRCAPLSEIDFRRRLWIPHSGWPFDRAEIDRYYQHAREVAGFGSKWRSDEETLALLKAPLPSLNPEWFRPFIWRYAPAIKEAATWRWANAYGTLLAEADNVRTLLHANFAEFSLSRDRARVRSVTVRALNGVAATIEAEKYVLCCGGIENARLLLLESQRNSGGFGNDHDRVGRYFMQHLRGRAGLIVSAEPMALVQNQFNLLRGPDGLQVEVGLTLTPEIMEREALLNCSSVLQYEADHGSGVTAAQDIWRALQTGRWPPEMGEKVGLIAEDFQEVAGVLEHRLTSNQTLANAGIPSKSAVLLVDLEPAPDPESRILLAEDRDALGLRRVKTDWRHGERERRTATRLASLVAAEFARVGIGRTRLEPWLRDERVSAVDALEGVPHYIGTTRMSDDPREGVVDRNCAVHGMENLYVAGSSVFPTAGQANPTLTIVALALRLAKHLRE
ncbi:MAG: FAD-dependent oxidoreductase [Steroidobacteraceae bacterium]